MSEITQQKVDQYEKARDEFNAAIKLLVETGIPVRIILPAMLDCVTVALVSVNPDNRPQVREWLQSVIDTLHDQSRTH